MAEHLSNIQLNVLSLMGKGWELGKDCGMLGSHWLQKGGIGRGGESKNVNGNTAFALWKHGYIKTVKREFPTEYYGLTDKGIQTLEEKGLL